VLPTHHEFHFLFQDVAGFIRKTGVESRNFVFPQRNPDFADRVDGGKLAQGVNQNRCSAEFSELLGWRFLLTFGADWHRSHARTQTGSRNYDNHLHRGL